MIIWHLNHFPGQSSEWVETNPFVLDGIGISKVGHEQQQIIPAEWGCAGRSLPYNEIDHQEKVQR